MSESPSSHSPTSPSPHSGASPSPFPASQPDQIRDRGDAGYNKSLKNRHLQMIAIGGSIGTGLFMGAGGRLKDGGAGLMFAYAVCGIFALPHGARSGRACHPPPLLGSIRLLRP